MHPWAFRFCLALLLVTITLAVLAIVIRAVFRGPVLKPAAWHSVEPPPMRLVTTGWSYREERVPVEEIVRRMQAGEL